MQKTMHSLSITIASVEESPVYDAKDYDGLEIVAAHIVERGTAEGNPTVDILLIDKDGRKHVVMTTGNLIEALGGAVAGVRVRTTAN